MLRLFFYNIIFIIVCLHLSFSLSYTIIRNLEIFKDLLLTRNIIFVYFTTASFQSIKSSLKYRTALNCVIKVILYALMKRISLFYVYMLFLFFIVMFMCTCLNRRDYKKLFDFITRIKLSTLVIEFQKLICSTLILSLHGINLEHIHISNELRLLQ